MPLKLKVLRNGMDLSRVAELKNVSCHLLLASQTEYRVTVALGKGHGQSDCLNCAGRRSCSCYR